MYVKLNHPVDLARYQCGKNENVQETHWSFVLQSGLSWFPVVHSSVYKMRLAMPDRIRDQKNLAKLSSVQHK